MGLTHVCVCLRMGLESDRGDNAEVIQTALQSTSGSHPFTLRMEKHTLRPKKRSGSEVSETCKILPVGVTTSKATIVSIVSPYSFDFQDQPPPSANPPIPSEHHGFFRQQSSLPYKVKCSSNVPTPFTRPPTTFTPCGSRYA